MHPTQVDLLSTAVVPIPASPPPPGSSSGSSGKTKMAGGAIAGIVVGVLVGLAVIAAAMLLLNRIKVGAGQRELGIG